MIQLKNDRGFITEKVAEQDFLNYIEFINQSEITFNSSNNNINFIKNFNQIQTKQRINEKNIEINKNFEFKSNTFPYKIYIQLTHTLFWN